MRAHLGITRGTRQNRFLKHFETLGWLMKVLSQMDQRNLVCSNRTYGSRIIADLVELITSKATPKLKVPPAAPKYAREQPLNRP